MMANRSLRPNAGIFVVLFLSIVSLATSANAQQLTFNWSWNATSYTIADFNHFLSGKTITVNVGAPIYDCTNVVLKTSGQCSTNSFSTATAGRCVYSDTTGTALLTFAEVPISFMPKSSDICQFQAINVRIVRCSDATCTAPGTGTNLQDNIFFSTVSVVLQPVTINTIVRLPTLIGAVAQEFQVSGGPFPNTGSGYMKVNVIAESIAGGPCNNPLGWPSWGYSTSALVRFTIQMNAQNDGCRILLASLSVVGINATGSGAQPGNNILAYSVGGNLAVTASTVTVFRNQQTVTISGNYLPRGPQEGAVITLATSTAAGTCSSPVMPCAIQTYGSTSLTCVVDTTVMIGDDATNGGCPLTATVTRLELTLTDAVTGMKCPNMLPPVAPLTGNPLSLKHSSSATSFTVATLNQAIGGKVFNATGFGSFPLVSSNPCTLVLNVSNCGAVTALPVSLASCQYDSVSKVLNGTLNPTPITTVIASADICTITEISLAANFCMNAECNQTSVYSFLSNTIFASSVPKLINAAPTVNAITKSSTRVGGASTTLTLSGSNLPRMGDQVGITFALTSIAGGPCDTPITSYTIISGATGNSMDISYFVSTANDGCSISLTKLTRAGIPATGPGVTAGTNVLRDFVAGNPVISFGSPDSLNRTMDAVIYLNGSNLPVGAAESGSVTLTTSGGDCWMPAPINCVITSFGSSEITCTANLLTLYGDDPDNAGCLINAAVTRLGIVGPSDSTGIRSINWDNLMPPVAAPADAPVDAPVQPPSMTAAVPQAQTGNPSSSGVVSPSGNNGGLAPTDNSNVGGSSNSGAVIGGAVGGSIAGALVIAGIAVAIVYLMKKKPERPKSLEMDSPFELPGGH